MRIPLSWLAEFVTWSRPAAALAERLTMAGVKIEAIEEVGRLDPRIVAGRRAPPGPPPPPRRPRGGRGGGGGAAAPPAPPPAARRRGGGVAPPAPPGAR